MFLLYQAGHGNPYAFCSELLSTLLLSVLVLPSLRVDTQFAPITVRAALQEVWEQIKQVGLLARLDLTNSTCDFIRATEAAYLAQASAPVPGERSRPPEFPMAYQIMCSVAAESVASHWCRTNLSIPLLCEHITRFFNGYSVR